MIIFREAKKNVQENGNDAAWINFTADSDYRRPKIVSFVMGDHSIFTFKNKTAEFVYNGRDTVTLSGMVSLTIHKFDVLEIIPRGRDLFVKFKLGGGIDFKF